MYMMDTKDLRNLRSILEDTLHSIRTLIHDKQCQVAVCNDPAVAVEGILQLAEMDKEVTRAMAKLQRRIE